MGTLKTNEEIKKEISETMEELSWVVEGGDAHDLQDACDKAHACLADTLALIERLESDVSFYKNISALNAKTCRMQNELIEEIKTDRARLSENIMWMEAERDDLKRYIRQLETELEDMTARYKIADDCAKKKGEMNETLYAELSGVKAERDALLHDLSFNLAGSGYVCDVCKHAATDTNDPPCNRCYVLRNGIDSYFEWRGVQTKEESNDQ